MFHIKENVAFDWEKSGSFVINSKTTEELFLNREHPFYLFTLRTGAAVFSNKLRIVPGYLLILSRSDFDNIKIAGGSSYLLMGLCPEQDHVFRELRGLRIPVVRDNFLNLMYSDDLEKPIRKSYLQHEFEDFIRQIHSILDALPYKKYSTKIDVLLKILHVRKIIDDNFTSNISVDDLSREAGISKYLLIRTFTRIFHVSPKKYYLEKKIELAKEIILEKSKLSITQVSNSCGFSNIQHFSNCFKKMTGLTPTEYKKSRFRRDKHCILYPTMNQISA